MTVTRLPNYPITQLPDYPITQLPDYPIRSDKREAALAEVAIEDRARVGAEPVVDHRGVYRSEVGFVVHVGCIVFERRIIRIRVQHGRRAIEAAVHLASEHHHHRRRAVIGTGAAV